PGEGDLAVSAPEKQIDVDELSSVFGVHPQDRERHLVGDAFQGAQDAFGLFAGDGAVLGPTSGDVSDRERECERADGVSAVVGDQIDLNEAPLSVIPVCAGAYGHLTSQQRPGLGGGTPLDLTLGSFTCQATIDG